MDAASRRSAAVSHRPQPRSSPGSGTQLTHRCALVGISIDRVFGDVGVMGGLNFIERQTGFAQDSAGGKIRILGSRTYRKGRWFAGINFAL